MRGVWQRHGNVAGFCAAHFLSAFGYEFVFFMMTLHVYRKQGRAADVAVFAAITLLPRLLAPLLGSLVDRFPQERLFAVTLALGAGLTAIVPFTRRELVPWTCIAILSMLFGLVRTTLMTRVMADPGHLAGNSAMLLSLNAAKLGAPLAGAAAAACLPFRTALLGAGGIFLLAGWFAWHVKVAVPVQEPAGTPERSTPGFLKGFTELWRVDRLRFLFLLSLVWRLFLGAQVSLFIVLVKRNLGGSDADYGLFMTSLGLGSLLGSLAGPWIVRRISSSRAVMLGMALHFATSIVLSWTPSLGAAVLAAAASYAVLHATAVGAHSLRDQATFEAARGRVFGANTAILSIAGIASMLAGGRLADLYGVSTVLAAAGFLALSSLLALCLLSRPFKLLAQPEA